MSLDNDEFVLSLWRGGNGAVLTFRSSQLGY